jgi:hypothetical protein
MSDDFVKDGEYLPAGTGEFLGAERAPIHVNQSTDPADVVKTSQGIRLQILKHRLARGVNDDAKELNLDLQLLRDLDANALTTRKIDVEERAVNEAEQVSQQTNALLKLLGGKNPFAVDLNNGGALRQDLIGRSRETALPEPKIVPGHTKQGTDNLNYGDFVDDPDAEDDDQLEEEEEV